MLTCITTDDSLQKDEADEVDDSTPDLPERSKRGPPTNMNIPVRNIKAQISNMSAKENAGFKSEYNVRLIFKYILFLLLIGYKMINLA